MVGVSRGPSSLFVGKPFVAEVHTVHDSVAVDGGDVHLDAHDPDHLVRIKHTRNDGIDVLAAVDKVSGSKTVYMDSAGGIHNLNAGVSGTGHITCKGITLDGIDLETELGDIDLLVRTNEDTLESHQSDLDDLFQDVEAANRQASATKDNIMRRSPDYATSVANFQVVADDNDNYPANNSFPPRGLYWTRATCLDALDLLNNAQLQFRSFDGQGVEITTKRLVFGRAEPLVGETIDTASASRDGLLLEDEVQNQISEVYCNENVPNIRLTGIKAVQSGKPVCPVFEVIGQSSNTVFAIYDDGHVRWGGHLASDSLSGDADLLSDSAHASAYVGDNSLYIGDCRITFDRQNRALKLAVLKDQIPTYLTAAGVTPAEVSSFGASANGELSVHSWTVLAREHTNNEHLRIKDVFPAAAADWNDSVFDGHATAADMVQAQSDIVQAAADIVQAESDIVQAQSDITALQNAGSGSGPANLTDYSLNLDAGLTSNAAEVVVAKEWTSGNSNTSESVARIVLAQTDPNDVNSVKNQRFEMHISREDNIFKLFHRRDENTSVAASDMILMYNPSQNHIGLGGSFGGGAQHGQAFDGVCLKEHVRTWGSLDVGAPGNNANQNRKLTLHQDIGFVRRDANNQDEDLLEHIDDNVQFRRGPGAPILYVQGSSGNTGIIICTGETKTVLFHTHPSAGDYWLRLPPKSQTVDGHTITVIGGHGTGSSKAYIQVDPADLNAHPNHGFYENSTSLINNYIAMPLQQTKYTCVYNASGGTNAEKWWVFA